MWKFVLHFHFHSQNRESIRARRRSHWYWTLSHRRNFPSSWATFLRLHRLPTALPNTTHCVQRLRVDFSIQNITFVFEDVCRHYRETKLTFMILPTCFFVELHHHTFANWVPKGTTNREHFSSSLLRFLLIRQPTSVWQLLNVAYVLRKFTLIEHFFEQELFCIKIVPCQSRQSLFNYISKLTLSLWVV